MTKYGDYIPNYLYPEWEEDCLKWRGKVLTGRYSHWCFEFDGLPMDETCEREWDCCTCFKEDERGKEG